MLPNPHDGPAGFDQPAVGVSVPGSVRLDLRGPEFGIRRRDRVVIRASVPEAAVQEDGHLVASESEVGGTPDVLQRAY